MRERLMPNAGLALPASAARGPLVYPDGTARAPGLTEGCYSPLARRLLTAPRQSCASGCSARMPQKTRERRDDRRPAAGWETGGLRRILG
eukprot:364915-Chlamydomonas_euryale.AAC.28